LAQAGFGLREGRFDPLRASLSREKTQVPAEAP